MVSQDFRFGKNCHVFDRAMRDALVSLSSWNQVTEPKERIMSNRISRTAPSATHPKDRALFERIDSVLSEYEKQIRQSLTPRRRTRRTR